MKRDKTNDQIFDRIFPNSPYMICDSRLLRWDPPNDPEAETLIPVDPEVQPPIHLVDVNSVCVPSLNERRALLAGPSEKVWVSTLAAMHKDRPPYQYFDILELDDRIVGVSGFRWETLPPSPTAPAPAVVLPFRPMFPAAADADIVRRSIWPGTYQEYIATKEYQRLAAQAKRDWNFECILDRSHRGPVEMHHRTYMRVPFGESWWDLIPLCEECHARYHHRLPAPPPGLFDELRRAA